MLITFKPRSYQLQKNIKWVASGIVNFIYNNGLNGETTSIAINNIFFDTQEEANNYFKKFCKEQGYIESK